MENTNLKSRLRFLEIEYTQNLNHQRRNNIVISGIPSEIEVGDLKPMVKGIMSAIDIEVSSKEISGILHLRSKNEVKNNKLTIVSFTNRRITEDALKNRKRLMVTDMKNLDCLLIRRFISMKTSAREHRTWVGSAVC